MIFDSLMRLLATPEPPPAPDLRLSVAVLLLEAARQDDTFDAHEREMIEKLLTRRFALEPQDCKTLMAAAEARSAQMTQLHGHTSRIAAEMAPQDRVQLIEMLWDVAYADGVLDPEEDLLIRRIAGLIYVSDRDRVLARQRALARRDQQAE
jgi:uncharacterized tellurite resistance protein B-like protein